jgi:hypothetical protein
MQRFVYVRSYAVTDTAYRALKEENRDQCILISGEKNALLFLLKARHSQTSNDAPRLYKTNVMKL